jgi:hypothetical protein
MSNSSPRPGVTHSASIGSDMKATALDSTSRIVAVVRSALPLRICSRTAAQVTYPASLSLSSAWRVWPDRIQWLTIRKS